MEQARCGKLCSSLDHHLGHPGWFTASGSTHLRPIQGERAALSAAERAVSAQSKVDFVSSKCFNSNVVLQFGFFKRSLPYGTAMEKAELKPQAASEA